MGDWLGTGRLADQLRVYRSFENARAFVHQLNLKSGADWKEFTRSGRKPDDIPAAPWNTYSKDWKSMGDWLNGKNCLHRDELATVC
jgi:hypothetical protein